MGATETWTTKNGIKMMRDTLINQWPMVSNLQNQAIGHQKTNEILLSIDSL